MTINFYKKVILAFIFLLCFSRICIGQQFTYDTTLTVDDKIIALRVKQTSTDSTNFSFELDAADTALIRISTNTLSKQALNTNITKAFSKVKLGEELQTELKSLLELPLGSLTKKTSAQKVFGELLLENEITYLGRDYPVALHLIGMPVSQQPYPQIKLVVFDPDDKKRFGVKLVNPALVTVIPALKELITTIGTLDATTPHNIIQLYGRLEKQFIEAREKSERLRELHWKYEQFDLVSTDTIKKPNEIHWGNFLTDITKESTKEASFKFYISDLASGAAPYTRMVTNISSESIELLVRDFLGNKDIGKSYEDNANILKSLSDKLLNAKIEDEEEQARIEKEKEVEKKKQEEEAAEAQKTEIFSKTFFFQGDVFRLRVKKSISGDRIYFFELSQGDSLEKFEMGSLNDPEVYNKFMELKVTKIKGKSLSNDEESTFRNNASNLFIELVAKEKFASTTEPVAGNIFLKRKIPSYQIPSRRAFKKGIEPYEGQIKAQLAKARSKRNECRERPLPQEIANKKKEIDDINAILRHETDPKEYEKKKREKNKLKAEIEALKAGHFKPLMEAEAKVDSLRRADSYDYLLRSSRFRRMPIGDCKRSGGLCRPIRIDSMEVEFFEGRIKNILVMATLLLDDGDSVDVDHQNLIYYNTRPIAFSSFRNIEKIKEIDLRAFTDEDDNKDRVFLINLADVMGYKPALNLYSEDYSPKNQVIVIKPNVPGSVQLTKDNVVEIVKARVYSDFIGLNDDAPNGLIQTEVSQRFNINPSIYTGKRKSFWHRGYFSFIEPNITISKIEQDNRDVPLKMVEVDKINGADTIQVTTGVSTTLELFRRARFNIGSRFNVLFASFPEYKSTIYFNVGANYFQVSASDSSNRVNNPTSLNVPIETHKVNLFGSYCEVLWDVKPHPQLGFNLAYRIMRLKSNTEEFKQVINVDDLDVQTLDDLGVEQEARMLSSYHMNFTVRPSRDEQSKSELFFRASYYSSRKDRSQNFLQVQAGYSFFLFK